MTKKLPALKKTTVMQELKSRLPAAVAAPSSPSARGSGQALQVLMPPDTLKALKLHAVEQDTTVRALVLQALAKAGYPVPQDEVRDRRRG